MRGTAGRIHTDRVTRRAARYAVDVVGLGYCNWDYLGIVDRIPEFDASVRDMADFVGAGGGPVATALVALARLGVRTGHVGILGDDEPGFETRRAFEEEGVDVCQLRVQRGARSKVSLVLVEASTGRRSIVCYRGSHDELQLQDSDREYVTAARFLHLDGNQMGAAITAARWMREAGGRVVLDANKPRARLDELLPLVDVLITNATFPEAYTGHEDLSRAQNELMGTGASMVVTTLGEDGCACLTVDSSVRVVGFAVDVVDTTGAGDAFHGGFIYGLLQDWDLARTARFANAVAALSCTALGGRAALPRLQNVEAFLEGRC